MADKSNENYEKLPFEAAIDKAGFGLYSYIMTSLAGVAIISFVCIVFASTIIVPTSACELQTTGSQQGLLAAGPIVGSVLGGILWGYLADTRGRRKMLLVALIGGIVFNLVASISVNWVMLMLFQFFASCLHNGQAGKVVQKMLAPRALGKKRNEKSEATFTSISASGLYSMSMSLLSESVPMAKRNLVVLLVSSIFLLSQGIMAVLAIPIIPLSFSYDLPALGIKWNSWRTLLVVYSSPGIITTIWLFFMKESPKFVFIKGDEARAMDILRTIHRINHRSKEELEVKGLLQESNAQATAGSSPKDQIVPLFKHPLLKFTIIMIILFVFNQVGAFLVWLPTIADQFVRILESGENSDLSMCGIINMEAPPNLNAVPCALNTTSLLMVLGMGALQSTFNIIISIFVGVVGRRNMVMLVAALCGVSGILVNLVPNAIGSAVFFAVLGLGVVVIGLYTAIVVALFPTHLRALAIALPMTGGRVGQFACIQILNMMLSSSCEAGFYLFSSLFAASAIVASFLPDDRRLQKAPPPAVKMEEDVQEKL